MASTMGRPQSVSAAARIRSRASGEKKYVSAIVRLPPNAVIIRNRMMWEYSETYRVRF
jgi:hypothetical protein